jgi:hypothetical protein
MTIKLPIGYDNFRDIIDRKLSFVDKSLFIKDFLDDDVTQVSLITRPRRFGKTLNLSMLHHFFTSQVRGLPTKELFTGLKIMQQGPEYLQHQGKYPVVALSFKDVKDGGFQSAYANLCNLLSRTYEEHLLLLDSHKLTSRQKINFEAVYNREADESQIKSSLLDLTDCLYQHYGKQAILLLDEYDTPIHSGYTHGYYDKIVEVIRHLFSAALKSNPYLYRAMLTGILRIAKESLFSGLNNLKVYSIFNHRYSECFGFTEDEVNALLGQSQLTSKAEEIKSWYNGYRIGDTLIYNPWSIVNCIHEKGNLQTYWVNTSDNMLIKSLMIKSSSTFKESFESLLQGKSINAIIDENHVFGDLDISESAIWSLLLFTGYLKAIQVIPEDINLRCTLLPPNQEVIALYKNIVKKWFTDRLGQEQYQQFLTYLIEGKIDIFTIMLKQFLLETASAFDVKGKHPEKFYHGFVLGLIASLEKTHIIKSNRESGFGRYDVMIIPKNLQQLGLILEFKTAEDTEDNLEDVAREALAQIDKRNYVAELHQMGIKRLLKIGLAFRSKDVAVVSKASD